MSRIIRVLFDRFYFHMYALIIGLVIGALVVIYPGFELDKMRNIVSVICLIGGLIAAYGLGKLELDRGIKNHSTFDSEQFIAV